MFITLSDSCIEKTTTANELPILLVINYIYKY